MSEVKRLQWKGDNCAEVADLLPDHNFHHKQGELIIHQVAGDVKVPKGHWFAVDQKGFTHVGSSVELLEAELADREQDEFRERQFRQGMAELERRTWKELEAEQNT